MNNTVTLIMVATLIDPLTQMFMIKPRPGSSGNSATITRSMVNATRPSQYLTIALYTALIFANPTINLVSILELIVVAAALTIHASHAVSVKKNPNDYLIESVLGMWLYLVVLIQLWSTIALVALHW